MTMHARLEFSELKVTSPSLITTGQTMPRHVSQCEIFGELLKLMSKLTSRKAAEPFRMNACVEAADILYEHWNREPKKAAPGSGVRSWLESDEVGMSSGFLCYSLTGLGPHRENHYPHDPDDFSRCVNLMDSAPDLLQQLHKMKAHGPAWSGLVDRWDELTELLKSEMESGRAPKTYAAIKQIIAAAGEPL